MKLSSPTTKALLSCICASIIASGCTSSEIKNAALGTGAAIGVAAGVTCMVATIGIGAPGCGLAFQAGSALGSLASEELYQALLLDEEQEGFKEAVDESLETNNKTTWRSSVRPDVKVDIDPQTPILKPPSMETGKEFMPPDTKPKQNADKLKRNSSAKDDICKTANFVYYIGEKIERKSNKFCLENGRWVEKS